MTGAQASYLKTLCEEAHEEFQPSLSKAEASKRIDELQKKTGRGRGSLMARRPSVPSTTASVTSLARHACFPTASATLKALLSQPTRLLQTFQSLPFKEFEFHGFTGKRRVVSFGWRYDINGGGLHKTEDIPPFLQELRTKAAGFCGGRPIGPSTGPCDRIQARSCNRLAQGPSGLWRRGRVVIRIVL